MKWIFLGDSVKVDESLFEEIDDLDIGDAGSSDESWTFFLGFMCKTQIVNIKYLKKIVIKCYEVYYYNYILIVLCM